jgi:hypothetical protein
LTEPTAGMFNTMRILHTIVITGKRILGEKSKEIVDLLKKAYCDEM